MFTQIFDLVFRRIAEIRLHFNSFFDKFSQNSIFFAKREIKNFRQNTKTKMFAEITYTVERPQGLQVAETHAVGPLSGRKVVWDSPLHLDAGQCHEISCPF